MDASRALLTALLREGDFIPVADAGIDARDFPEPDTRAVFEFVREFYLDHKTLPDRSTVEMDYPNVLLADDKAPEPVGYYIEETLTDTRFSLLFDGLREAAGEIDTEQRVSRDDLERAAIGLNNVLREFHDRGGALRSVDITRRASTWWAEYLAEERATRQIRGIPLGLPALDQTLQGLRPEQLVSIVGLPKSGKSLVALRAAVEANRWGYRPLIVSFEMSVQEQEERYHALNAQVSWTRMQQGRLFSKERKRVERSFRYRERNMGGFIIAEDPQSMTKVTNIATQIETHEPDIVFVDGVYMMDDEMGEDTGSPQAITNITRGLKRLAQKSKVPIVITTQALQWKTSKKNGVTAGSTGYSSSFLQDSDVMITINTDEEDPSIKWYSVALTRVGTPVVAAYKWDFNRTGVLEEVEQEESFDEFDGSAI